MMETKGYRENIRGIAEEKWRKDIPRDWSTGCAITGIR